MDDVRVPRGGPAGPRHRVPGRVRVGAVGDCPTLHGGQQPAGRHITGRRSHTPTGTRSINLAINQSINQPVNQSTNKPVNQSTNQQINKSTNQQINKSTN